MSLLKLKILIVDDDKDYTQTLTDYLEEKGHIVFQAATTEDAINLTRQQKARLLPIDLAFIDYIMPADNGILISHCLKELDPHMFLAALTEHDDPDTIKKLIQEGAFMQIISKFDNESETIDRLLAVTMNSKRERRKKGIDLPRVD